ncbi:MAG: biotin/lipoyl-containing protein [Porticoccaceae bacterium]|jgi:pyruvate/2-oxoglutarate dehydrogenase complex dihydrolipoamide acyltransferase (E2) component
MTVEVVVPKLGMAMSEGVLTEWLVKDGDSVKEGDEIVTIENDKSVQEIESPATGVIKLLANEGETYPVDTVLAEIN